MVGKCCCIIIGCLVGCVVFIGVTLLVYFLAITKVLPKALIQYEVTNASLTKFNLTADNTFLEYNLSLKLTLENPSDQLDYNLELLEAMPVFNSQNLTQDMTNLSKPFFLGHESNATLPVVFSGNHSVAFGDQEASDIGKADVFDIVLKVISDYSPETKKKMSFKQEVACNLKVPLNSNGTSSGESFQITKCDATKLEINKD